MGTRHGHRLAAVILVTCILGMACKCDQRRAHRDMVRQRLAMGVQAYQKAGRPVPGVIMTVDPAPAVEIPLVVDALIERGEDLKEDLLDFAYGAAGNHEEGKIARACLLVIGADRVLAREVRIAQPSGVTFITYKVIYEVELGGASARSPPN